MKVGFLTGYMGRRDFASVAEYAGRAGFKCLEVAVGPGSKHFDVRDVLNGKSGEVREILSRSGLEISSFAFYANLIEANRDARNANIEYFRDVIRASSALGIGVACTMAGFTVPGKDKFQSIAEDFAEVMGPLVDFAESMGVKVAMENYFATLIQGLAHWDAAFAAVPSKNLGLNFDPSHLFWQGIDYLGAVDKYRDRIFHTHAKDCLVKDEVVRYRGILEGGWWSYVIPGFGGIDWPKYIEYLRRIGYNDVLSIEHEDDALGVEEGLEKGLRYLSNWA